MNKQIGSCFITAVIVAVFWCAPLQGEDDFDRLAASIYQGDFRAVKELVESGVDVNVTNEMTGATPLIVACSREGSDRIIEYLLEQGAEVNVEGRRGMTPLMWAAENSGAAVNMLIARGADVNVTADDGMTPFIKAVFGIIMEDVTTAVCDTLLAHGADINAALTGEDASGMSALLFASNKKRPRLVDYLVSKGAEVNHQDNRGRSALMLASIEGDIETVNILVENGADPGLKTGDGSTALDMAKEKERSEVAEYLESL